MKTKKDFEQEARAKLLKMHPTEKHLLDALMTTMGCAAQLLTFIHQNEELFEDIPDSVKFALSLVAGHMQAFTSADPDVQYETMTFPLIETISSEKHEDILRKKLRMLIDMLSASMKEEDKI